MAHAVLQWDNRGLVHCIVWLLDSTSTLSGQLRSSMEHFVIQTQQTSALMESARSVEQFNYKCCKKSVIKFGSYEVDTAWYAVNVIVLYNNVNYTFLCRQLRFLGHLRYFFTNHSIWIFKKIFYCSLIIQLCLTSVASLCSYYVMFRQYIYHMFYVNFYVCVNSW